MLIESISIAHFGKLHNLEFDFNEGLNVIEGKNESGKSTIAGFIRYMLYGFSGIADKRHFISWETSSAQGSMTVRIKDGSRYRIDRKTLLVSSLSGKDQYKDTSSITDLKNGTSVFGREKAGDVLLGIPEEVFDSIAFVNQLSDLSVDGVAINEAIENMLFSGNEKMSAQRALEKIDSARRALLHKNEKGGEIFNLSEKIAELNRNLNDSIEDNSLILEYESGLRKAEEDLKQTEKDIELLASALDTYQKMQTLEKFSKLHLLEDKKNQIENEIEALIAKHTVDGFCPDASYVSELAVVNRSLKDSNENLKRALSKQKEWEDKASLSYEYSAFLKVLEENGGLSQVKKKEGSYNKNIKNCLSLFLITLAMAVSSFAIYFLDVYKNAFCLGFGGGVLAVSILNLCIFARSKGKLKSLYASLNIKCRSDFSDLISAVTAKKEETELNLQGLDIAKRNTSDVEAVYSSRENEYKRVLSLLGKDIPQDRADEYIKLLSDEILAFRAEEEKKRMDIVRLQTSIDELSNQLNGIDEKQLDEALTPEKRTLINDIDINSAQKTLLFLREKQRALLQKEKDLRTKYIALKAKTDNPSAIKEKIDEHEEKLSSLRKQYDAYILASEAISGAGDRLRYGLSPRLSEYACRAVAQITENKYTEIGVSPALSLSYTYDNVKRAPESLSQGTRAVFYLSLRLALVDLLCKEKIPLCLDESLVYQDRERTVQILKLLEGETKENLQCFVFTCHEREATLLEGHNAKIIRI